MSKTVQTFTRALAIAGLATVLGASSALAGPFSEFAGNWRGAGRITDVNGRSERLSCRSTISPSSDGIAMNMTLVCASDSYKVDFRSDVYTDGQALHGTWTEATRGVDGNLGGAIGRNVINATTTAPGFSANIAIHVVGGRRLDVSLAAHGVSISRVQVSMRR